MQSYGSFQSVSNLLRLVAHDYGLADDLTVKYLHFASPMDSMSMPMPMAMAMPLKAGAPTPASGPTADSKSKKPRKAQIHVPGVSCCGTNRHGKLCCNSRAKESEFCRWHLDQKDNPVALTVDPPTQEADAESFSVHTPVHSRRPSVSSPDPTRLASHEKFRELASGKCGCHHLVKNVAFETYQGPAIALTPNFGVEDMFRSEASKMGLFLADIDGHMTPCGYIPADDADVCPEPVLPLTMSSLTLDEDDTCSSTSVRMPSLTLEPDEDEDEYPIVPNTPTFHTDTEADELPTDLTEESFQSYAEGAGLDEYFDANVTTRPDCYPFGVYISSMDDITENVKLLKKTLKSVGIKSKIVADEDDEDEKFLLIKRPN